MLVVTSTTKYESRLSFLSCHSRVNGNPEYWYVDSCFRRNGRNDSMVFSKEWQLSKNNRIIFGAQNHGKR